MKYDEVVTGIFKKRINRFIAHVWIEGKEEMVHVKNTGRCRELLLPGVMVWLEVAQSKQRKTKYSIVAVQKGERIINMDAQAPNKVVEEAILSGKVEEIREVKQLKREAGFQRSRFDFYFETPSEKGFLEVKGVTLEEQGVVKFPDAPTQRGTRHIEEMIQAIQQGYACYFLFLVQMEEVQFFTPHNEMDGTFAQALIQGVQQGLKVLAYDCAIKPDEICINGPVKIHL